MIMHQQLFGRKQTLVTNFERKINRKEKLLRIKRVKTKKPD